MTSCKCSRKLPKPIRLWVRKDSKERLRYVVYPNLNHFKLACQKCKFRVVVSNHKGKSSRCRLKDPEFSLKFYHRDGKKLNKIWCGTVPSHLKLRYPSLYEEIVEYFRSHRARSLRKGILHTGSAGETKLFMTDGIDVLLPGDKSNASRSEDVEQSSDL